MVPEGLVSVRRRGSPSSHGIGISISISIILFRCRKTDPPPDAAAGAADMHVLLVDGGAATWTEPVGRAAWPANGALTRRRIRLRHRARRRPVLHHGTTCCAVQRGAPRSI
jgi:hypothetical protein